LEAARQAKPRKGAYLKEKVGDVRVEISLAPTEAAARRARPAREVARRDHPGKTTAEYASEIVELYASLSLQPYVRVTIK
jgi:hypothetical protein